MPRGIHDVTVSVPTYGNRRVTIIYPMTSGPNDPPTVNGAMSPGLHPMIMVGHGAIGNGSFSPNGEGIGFAGSSYLHRSMTDIGYVIVAPHFTNVVGDMQEGTDVAKFFITYAITTWAQQAGIDEDKIGYAGTSMGGMIAYALMHPTRHDPRIKAYYVRATNTSGTPSTPSAMVVGPALCHAHGTGDTTVSFSSGQAAYARHGQPRAFITLPGINHDLAVSGPYYTNDASPATSGLAGFFGYFLNGDSNGLTILQTAVTNVSNPDSASMSTDWGTPSALPTISSFSPLSAAEGEPVVITGTNLNGATIVRFNGTSSAFTVDGPNQITTSVPVGATDGQLQVVTPSGTATSAASFDVTAPPIPNIGTPWAGTWNIREVGTNSHTPQDALSTGANNYNAARPQILGGMNVGCFVGFGLRVGWDAIETGRILTTANAAIGATSISCVANNHPALTAGTVLSFEFGTGMGSTIVTATLSANAVANSGTISVNALSTAIGSGARAGIYSDIVLDACYADIQPLGYMMAPRIMNGKYTPASLAADGVPMHGTPPAAPWPEAFDTSGNVPAPLLNGQKQLYRHLFAWADAKNAVNPGSVPIVNIGSLPGLNYAEMYYSQSGAGADNVAALWSPGNQTTNMGRMVTANSQLIDAIVAISAGRYPIAMGLSGTGNLYDVISPGLAAKAESFGVGNNVMAFNANGWAPNGEWGSGQETTFDNNVWVPNDAKRGVQDISPTAPRTVADWQSMFGTHALGLPTRPACWAEIYAYQVRNVSGTGIGISGMNANQAAWDEMVFQALAFNIAVADTGPVNQTVTAGLITQAPVLFNPTLNQAQPSEVSPAFMNQTAVLFAPTFFRPSTVTAPLLNQSAVMFAPKVGKGVATTLITQAPVLHSPTVQNSLESVVAPLIDQTAILNAPATTGGITPALIDQTAVIYTPSVLGARGEGSLSSRSTIRRRVLRGSPDHLRGSMRVRGQDGGSTLRFAYRIRGEDFEVKVGKEVATPLINQTAVVYAPALNTKFVLMPLIDRSPAVTSQNVVTQTFTFALIDQSPELFAFSMLQPFTLTPDLLDNSGVLFAPQVDVKFVETPLIDQSAFVYLPQVNPRVATPLLDQSGVLFAPTLDAILPPLIDQSGVLFAPDLRPVLPAIIDQSGVLFAPMVQLVINQSIRFDDDDAFFLDNSAVVYAPVVELAPPRTITMEFIDNEAVAFAPLVLVPLKNTVYKQASFIPVIYKNARFKDEVRKLARLETQG